MMNLLKRMFQVACYFCGKPATESGLYYEVHYYSGGSAWRRVDLCEECGEGARHCHYCTCYHGAYNCEEKG